MIERMLHRLKPAVAVGCTLALLSCSEEPPQNSSVTSPNLPIPVVNLKDTVISPISSGTYKRFTPMDGRYNLVGVANGRTAVAAVEFYPSYLPVIDTIRIASARLRLLMHTSFGNPSGTLRFTAHKILRSWLSYTMTWDTLQAGLYESTVRGSYTGTGGPDSQWVSVPLDTSLVREWLSSSSDVTKYGVVLVPDPSSTVIRGFFNTVADTAAWRPTLEITALNYPGAAAETTVVFNYGMDTFVGNIDQSVTLDPGLLSLQAGVVLEGTLKFDLSFIPRGSTVLLSELYLERDPSTSWLVGSVEDTAISGHLITAEGTPPTFIGAGSGSLRPPGTANTYRMEITSAVQSWVRGPNYGLVLRNATPSQYQTMGMISVYSHTAADPARRPRLKVVYGTQGG